jgi:hypothetical protein
MTVQIQFIDGFFETTLPLIKLTKSINGKTGTATFILLNLPVFLSYQKTIYMVCIYCGKLKKLAQQILKLF